MTAVSIREAFLFKIFWEHYLSCWLHFWLNSLPSKYSADRLNFIFVAKMRFDLWSFWNVFITWLFYKPIMGLTKMIWTLQWLLHLTEASTKLSMKQENISEKKFLGTRVRSSKRCCVRFPTLRFMSTRPLDLDSLSAACLLLRILPLTIIELVQQLSQERKRATLGPSVKDFCAATAFPAWHWRRGVKKGGDMIYTLIRNV